MTWDDHEVANDYARDRGQDLDPDFLARRAAAYRAYFEHLPVRPSALRPDGEYRLYGAHAWGALANLFVLDDRQYRAHQACPRPSRGGSNVVGPDCAERARDGRTMLGEAQERWLDGALAGSKSRWNLLAQQTLMAPAGRPTDKGVQHWTDGWDGYPRARARLLQSLATSGAANPVVLGGDVHANYVANLHARPDEAGLARASPRNSAARPSRRRGPTRSSWPPSATRTRTSCYADGSRRGYVMLDVGRERLEARLRVLDTVARTDAGVSTAATFTVRAGRPGIAA